MDLPLAQKETIRQDMQGVGNLGDGFVQGQTEQNFGENSEKKGVVKTEELTAEQMKVYRQMSSFAEARGGRIVVRDDMEPGNPGCIIKNDDGTFEIVVSNEALADYVVMGHELTHALEGTEEYGEYAEFIESELESRGVDIAAVKADITRVYAEYGKVLDDPGAAKELIAMYTAKHLFDDQVVINRLAVEKPNLFQRIWEWIQDKIASLRGRDAAFYIDTRKRFIAAYRSAGGAYEGRWGEDTGRQDWLSPKFEQEYNNWIKNGRKDSGLLFVGRTSKALQSIGVKNQRIVWDTGKINKTLAKHKNLNDEILKQVPNIIEKPVLIMESISKENKGNNRVVIYGEVYDINGLPVLAVLELEPNNRQGVVINEIKIASTYSKDSNAQATQKLIDNSKILYIDPNKKRTENWLSFNRLQLPLGVNQFGSIGRVAYSSDIVKQNAKENSGNFNNALAEQLLAKGFASDNSIRKNDRSDTQNSIDFDIDEIISRNQKGGGKAWSETVKEFDKVKKKVKTDGKQGKSLQGKSLYEGLFEVLGKKGQQTEVLKGSLADVLGIETASGREAAASLEEEIGKKRTISQKDRRAYFENLFGEYRKSHGSKSMLGRTKLWQIFTTYLDDLQEANGLRRNMPRMKDVPRFEIGGKRKSGEADKTQSLVELFDKVFGKNAEVQDSAKELNNFEFLAQALEHKIAGTLVDPREIQAVRMLDRAFGKVAKGGGDGGRTTLKENLGDGIIRKKSEPMSRYLNSSEDIYYNASRVKPIDGYEDIFIHGDKTGFAYKNLDGVETDYYTPREFAEILRSDPNYNGGNIRLFACESGADGAITAQILSNILNVDVLAPSDIVWIDSFGNFTIGHPCINKGEWRLFKPQDNK